MEYRSPAFSEFRELMDQWDEAREKLTIQTLLGDNDLIFFFKKDGVVYGTPESSRVTYARMKNPDEDSDKAWVKEASFMAVNLSKAMEGQLTKVVFNHTDLEGMNVIDQDIAEKSLTKIGGGKKIKVDLKQEPEDEPTSPDASPTINKIREK